MNNLNEQEARQRNSSKRQGEDKALVEILQNDNSPSREKDMAFNKLYLTHQRGLMLFLLGKTKDIDLAEDLKMVAFEKVYRAIKKYDSKYAFSTWLYRIALNGFIDEARKESYKNISMDEMSGKENDEFNFQFKSYSKNPLQIISQNERNEKVREAIDSIDNEFTRELLENRFLHEMSFEQIAEHMCIENNSTLRVTIRRGKKILAEILKDVEKIY